MSEAIINAIRIIINTWSKIICERVKLKWGNARGVQGNAEINYSISVATSSLISSSIFSGGMKAWILEKGSGSLIDRDNEDLMSYINSDLWNKYRSNNDYKITGRDAGDYKDIDGNTQISSGALAGRIIESSRPSSNFKAILPMHIIQTEIDHCLIEIQEEVMNAVSDIVLDNIMLKFPKELRL